jgi:hypothetical protein
MTLEARQSDGAILSAAAPRLGSETVKATHNYCDPTTWWTESVEVNGETLTDSGDGLTWNSGHENWIDLVHGKVFEEDHFQDDYEVKVYVGGVEKTMRDPFATDWSGGGDYYVDFAAGNVIFQNDQTGNTVTADYHYENGSSWYLTPSENKELLVEKAEMQLSSDIEMTADLRYDIEINMGGGYFAYAGTIYKSTWQILMEARGAYPVIPVLGTGPRGTGVTVTGFPFIYSTARVLSSLNPPTRLRVKTMGDLPFEGSHASGTFYCLSKADPAAS